MYNYDYLLHTKTAEKWNKIGVKRRAGVSVPLFSIYSEDSIGIGEIFDLMILVDWCNLTGMSIIQLLPLNDTGYDFAPYNSLSTFALDPMYLSIRKLKGVNLNNYNEKLHQLKSRYRPRFGRVNYRIKKAKLDLLSDIFNNLNAHEIPEFKAFVSANEYWLKDYALYKVISESLPDNRWELWNDSVKYREYDALSEIESNNAKRLDFYYWIQWQLFEQMKNIKIYAESKDILLMGDLPFLVSRESADVWSHQNYFRLDLSAGAPPDMYFALGQKWGMPPYNWDNIAHDGFIYVKEKLNYAENFYDIYRIDHFVGLFRVWTSSLTGNATEGSFLPSEEYIWEVHGRRLIEEMTNSSKMLPCAEDLGTVPECSGRILYEYGIPGTDFQRYMKSNFYFRSTNEYRSNSCAVLSTHDSAFFTNWWQLEAGTIDEKLFEIMFFSQSSYEQHYSFVKEALFDTEKSKYGRLRWKEDIDSAEKMINILQPAPEKVNDFVYLYMESFNEKKKFLEFVDRPDLNDSLTTNLIYNTFYNINTSNSIFSIQLLHEYLCLDEELLKKIARFDYRINTPGKFSRKNWSLILPVSLETLADNKITNVIKELLKETNRL